MPLKAPLATRVVARFLPVAAAVTPFVWLLPQLCFLLSVPSLPARFEQVEQNIYKARDQWKECYNGITGEGIEKTAYGLVQASIEYQEWFRRANSSESRFRRSFLSKNAIVASAVDLALQAANES